MVLKENHDDKKVKKSDIEQDICVLLFNMQQTSILAETVVKKKWPPNYNNNNNNNNNNHLHLRVTALNILREDFLKWPCIFPFRGEGSLVL